MPKAKQRKFARIYYNEPGRPELYWRVRVRDASKSIKINGTLADALAGIAGSTVGCHLSNTAMRNKDKFPHAIILASFTKTGALIVDQVKNGQPHSAMRYTHRCGNLVDLNDTDKEKKKIRANPKLAEKTFTLYAPYKVIRSRPQSEKIRPRGTYTGAKRSEVLSGALSRAVKAGLISRPIAQALSK